MAASPRAMRACRAASLARISSSQPPPLGSATAPTLTPSPPSSPAPPWPALAPRSGPPGATEPLPPVSGASHGSAQLCRASPRRVAATMRSSSVAIHVWSSRSCACSTFRWTRALRFAADTLACTVPGQWHTPGVTVWTTCTASR